MVRVAGVLSSIADQFSARDTATARTRARACGQSVKHGKHQLLLPLVDSRSLARAPKRKLLPRERAAVSLPPVVIIHIRHHEAARATAAADALFSAVASRV